MNMVLGLLPHMSLVSLSLVNRRMRNIIGPEIYGNLSKTQC